MYDRLTKRKENGAVVVPFDNMDIVKIAYKLCEIEDKICEGKIVELPCAIGDIVYCLTECSCENIDGVHTECEFYGYGEDDRLCTIPNGQKCPYQYRIQKCSATEMNVFMYVRQWGITAFATPEEAKKKLKELENERRN